MLQINLLRVVQLKVSESVTLSWPYIYILLVPARLQTSAGIKFYAKLNQASFIKK